MNESILHDRENWEGGESILKENGKKFEGDCVKVFHLLYRGMRLTAKQTNEILNMADGGRRLREIFANRKDCKKASRRTNGKFEGVEYWLEISHVQTKKELIQRAESAIQKLKKTEKNLVAVFELDANPPSFQQQSLFP